MKKDANGNFLFALRYIARKEEFQKAITEFNSLPVMAVYPDGDVISTKLEGYIKEVSSFNGVFLVMTSSSKKCLTIHLI